MEFLTLPPLTLAKERERKIERGGGAGGRGRDTQRHTQRQREEQKHNPTSKTSFLKLLKNVTSYTSY